MCKEGNGSMDELNKLREEIINSETFCFYPFLELSTNPSGHIKPCCNYKGTLKNPKGEIIGVLNGYTFDDAWNSNPIVNLRKKLTTGTIPDQCNPPFGPEIRKFPTQDLAFEAIR